MCVNLLVSIMLGADPIVHDTMKFFQSILIVYHGYLVNQISQ
jgi:hypothetical protein